VQPLAGGSFLLAATTGDEQCYIWDCHPEQAAAALPAAASTPSPAAAAGQAPSQDAISSCSRFGSHAWQLQQTVPVGRHIQHCCALAPLPGDPQYIVLATGGTDSLIRLWLRAPGGQFQLSCQLTGHENWVRGLAFAAVAEEGVGPGEQGDGAAGVSLLLASASQDR
jgi:WD40 repeat protein